MTLLRRVIGGFRGLFHKKQAEQELDDELREYLETAAEQKMLAGMNQEQAARAARVEMGSLEAVKDRVRDVGWESLVETFWQDVRYAIRMLRRSPGFTAVAVLSLALGIGANAAIFSLVDTVLRRSLPVSDSHQLVVFASRRPGQSQGSNHAFSYDWLRAARTESRALTDVIASAAIRVRVEIDGIAESTIQGQLVSGNYYTMLGVGPALGRLVAPDDDGQPGARAVAVLSHAYWQRRFGQDFSVLGKTVRLNGYPFTIIGVSASGFFGTRLGTPADVTVPLAMQVQVMPEVSASWISDPYQWWLEGMGRLRANASERQAQAELDLMYQRHMDDLRAKADPGKAASFSGWRFELEPGSQGFSELRRRYARPLTVLMAVVALVLLTACANAANLLLARSLARRREIALRISLGAGRTRLVRQLLTESLVIATIGGLVGLLLAWWSTGPLRILLVGEQLQHVVAGPDLRVLVFTIGASFLTGLLFGVVPAFMTSHVDPHVALKDDARVGGGHRSLGRGVLVSAQVAISLMLLVCAGLFVRTLLNLRNVDLGMDQEHVLALRLEPQGSNQKRRPDGQLNVELMRTYGDLLARVEAMAGVRSASLSGVTPLGDENRLDAEIRVPGNLPNPGEDLRSRMIQIYPRYFPTLGISLVAGRDLTAADNEPEDGTNETRLAVINETMVRRFFGGADDAVGRRFRRGATAYLFEIVGVVKDVRDRGLREEVLPLVYATYTQATTGRGQMTLLVRTAGDPHAVAATVQQLARAIDPSMPLLEIETVAERVDASISQERLLAVLSSLFGAVALLLASIGLYGVMAYAVTSRRAEFGLRMALGATRGWVVGLVFKESLWLVAGGVAVGVPATLVASHFISSRLFGVSAADPFTIVGATALMIAVAALAALLPALRASKVDPLVALRAE